jgi:RimJ/RimL family protein N-acetyltransferase
MTMPLAVHSLQVRRVAAAIKKRNEASLRAFLRVGFRLEERGLGDARCETVEKSGFDSRCQVLYFDILMESVPQP